MPQRTTCVRPFPVSIARYRERPSAPVRRSQGARARPRRRGIHGRAPNATMRRKHHRPILGVLTIAAATAGCSATLPDVSVPAPKSAAAADAGIPSATVALQGGLLPQDLVAATPTEVYTRVARGVLSCWFGAAGPLKARYIYHAEAEPASKGGASEIKIMTRDAAADDPRALRAYRIVFAPSDGKTRVEIENVRIPEPLATRLKLDVKRWSRDEVGCEDPVTAGWSAEERIETSATRKGSKSKRP